MILSCNSCGAKFNVKDEDIGPDGRDVRCSVCAYEWFQPNDLIPKKHKAKAAKQSTNMSEITTLEETSIEQTPTLLDSKPSELDTPSKLEPSIKPESKMVFTNPDTQPLHQKVWLIYTLKYIAALTMVLLLFMLTITFRNPIINRFPASNAFFEAINLSDISNLKFDFVDCTLIKDESENADSTKVKLNIKVIVKNTSTHPQFLDAIRFSIYTRDKTYIGEYTMNLGKTIEGGKEEVIEGKLNHIPKEVTFVIIEMGNYFNLSLSRQSAILNYEQPSVKAVTPVE